jgi:hypothetical protein
MKRLLVTIFIVVALLVAVLGLAIALGGPGEPPPPMSSINDPFKNVDFSDLIQSPSKRQSRRLKAWITKSLTKRCSQPIDGVRTSFL